MNRLSSIAGTIALSTFTLASCSHLHRFEVDSGREDVARATLALYDRTTQMNVVNGVVLGERRRRADGSGWIFIIFADGSRARCQIGYVASGEEEPHRFVVEDGRCLPR